MINKITERVYAKINLCLAIKGKVKDMHLIDTIVTNIGVYDEITIKKRNDNKISVVYDNIKQLIKGDTAKKSAEILQKKYGFDGVDININKNIPFSAGLGGSSADAAGVAKCMQKLFGLEIDSELLLQIGSDVPYMFEGGDKRITGLGESVKPVSLPPLKYAVVICPSGVDTKKAYELYDKIGGDTPDIDKIITNINQGEPYILNNALQKAAIRLNPNITKGLDLLKKSGFSQIVMTGSGSGVVGVEQDPIKYKDNSKTLQNLINNDYKLILT